MNFNGELNAAQLRELRQTLAGLDLPQKKRQRLIWRLAKYGLIPAAKRHVRNQQTPDGQAWAKRRTRRKGRMLRNLPGLLHIREMPEIDGVRVYLQGGGYRNGARSVPAGIVGYAQQEGAKATVRAGQAIKQQAGRMASTAQAKKLRALGYQVKKGKRWRKPPFKEITDTMTYAQAGLLIRKLSGKAAKSVWSVDLPARPFLGMNDDEFNKALARQLQAIGYGWDVNAQDIRGNA